MYTHTHTHTNTRIKKRELTFFPIQIPLTFVLQVCLWCNKEILAQIFSSNSDGGDSISHIAHLSGAVVGTVMGYKLHYEDIQEKVKSIGEKWLQKSRQ